MADGVSIEPGTREASAVNVTREVYVAGGSQWHPLSKAAVIGGAIAATAGAYLGTRALARRNSANGKPLNSVMATAITACDVRHQATAEPPVSGEPAVEMEPTVAARAS